MTKPDERITPEDLQRLIAARHDLIARTAAAVYARRPGLAERQGERGRRATLEDLGYHLDYLLGALETGSQRAFADYLRWVGSVFQSRGLGTEGLKLSLTLLAETAGDLLSPAGADSVARLVNGAVPAVDEAPSGVLCPTEPLARGSQETLAHALLRGDRVLARKTLLAAQETGAGPVDVSVDLVQPAMYEVGRLWQSNRVSVAQEHLATATVQNLLTLALSAAEFAPSTGRKALFACVEGNHHALGLRMVADAFEVAGWEVQFLGANTPTGALVRQADEWHPDLIGLSASLVGHVPRMREAVSQLRGEFAGGAPVIAVGGLGINTLPDFWKVVGADLWAADARATVTQVAGAGAYPG